MGKYNGGECLALRRAPHPVLGKDMYVPADYTFFKKAECGKLEHAQLWTREFGDYGDGPVMLEAYAGCGILTMIYLEAGYEPHVVELKPGLLNALRKNIEDYVPVSDNRCVCADNMSVLPRVPDDDPSIRGVDLDAYSHCGPQIREAARILRKGLLFVSSGEILTVCRFHRTDFLEPRYGFRWDGCWRDFPKDVVYRYVREAFAARGKKTELLDAWSWPTISRICVKVG